MIMHINKNKVFKKYCLVHLDFPVKFWQLTAIRKKVREPPVKLVSSQCCIYQHHSIKQTPLLIVLHELHHNYHS